MAQITLRHGQGYRGKLGNKCYVAWITGTDPQYGLARVFIDATRVVREHYNRPRTMVNYTYDIEPGRLYEIAEEGVRRYHDGERYLTDGEVAARLAALGE